MGEEPAPAKAGVRACPELAEGMAVKILSILYPQRVSVFKSVIPANKFAIPAYKSVIPAKKSVIPTDKSAIPAYKFVIPANKSAIPAEEFVIPAEHVPDPDRGAGIQKVAAR